MRILLTLLFLATLHAPVLSADEAVKARRPQLQILNASPQKIDIFWLKSDTERVPNGSLAPGEDSVISTTLGHRFLLIGKTDGAEATVTSEAPIQAFRFDPENKHGAPSFYRHSTTANGFPIVGSRNVNPFALKEAAYLVNMMLAKRPDVRDAMTRSGSRLCIIAHNEFTTDLPEFARLGEGNPPDPKLKLFSGKDYWDARARGTGGSETDPYCSCGEENLLGYPGDPYSTECILIHEIAHNIHLRGMQNLDPTFDTRLRQAYRNAMDAGLWKGKYASVNHHEYFAEGVQSWFDNNRENDHDHNHVNTREELLQYDPGLAALCREVFGDTELKYTKPATRIKDHLAGYDPEKAPRFVWPERLNAVKVAIRSSAQARDKAANDQSPLLTIDRIFQSDEFQEEKAGSYVWSKLSSSYFSLEAPAAEGNPAKKPEGRDLVRIDAASGIREILVPAKGFIPKDAQHPLTVDAYEFSADEKKLLIFTNSKRVWRRNTRGDYWVLDLPTGDLRKLGGDAETATLMFAKFSPDANQVAYVCKNNLYVQHLNDLKVTPLTRDGSPHLINGTSDWVNEEELEIRDAYRWSPNGKSIAFWQFDTTGVAEFFLIDNTTDSHSKTTGFAYPKVGGTNSSARIGVVEVTGGPIRWLDIPGDPRNNYVARLEWLPTGDNLMLQQFNRLQNQNRVIIADPKTRATRTTYTETDEAWIENENPFRWLKNGRDYLWLSESDGWRHAYTISVEGTTISSLTPGEFDVIRVESVDEKNGKVYYIASPENPTQSYLYRGDLSGGKLERLTPSDQPGTHAYNISPNGEFAFHTYSSFTSPPIVEVVRLADHSVLRTLVANKTLKESPCKTEPARQRIPAIGHR